MKHLDDEFITKFLYCIDDRINEWLHECMRAKTVEETSLDLINFSSIITDIQLNKFVIFLPNSIKRLSKRPMENQRNENEREDKRVRQNNQIKNDNLSKDWALKQGESWNKIFKGKIKEGPMLECGTYPCLKYQVKGICYDDCSFRASHINLKGQDASKTDTFIKNLRSAK